MTLLLMCLLAANLPDLPQLERMLARFAPTELRVDTAALPEGDRAALPKLIDAARVLDRIYLQQVWSGNLALQARLQQDASPLGRLRLRYFRLNQGPWSDLDGHTAFLPEVPPRKPLGANFYPEDITREEFESWAKTHPEARGFFSVIRREGGTLAVVPYSRAYAADLRRAAGLLREAAALTSNSSLKKFLTLRAAAFLNDDYYASDVAWMELDAPLDITIGPYETYTDELFGYKAAFEAYVNVRDDRETTRLASFAGRLQEIENNLPIPPRYRNPKLGALAPIRVVNQVFASGDAAHGVATAAYNLPNDERVVREKGSKRVMLKNVQEAKFRAVLEPIAARVLPRDALPELTFDAFFTHILAHELTHGIGPHQVRAGGRDTTVRHELKELYGAIEEAKADITGLFMLQYLLQHGLEGGEAYERRLYTTYLASAFRSLRFGLSEAHGRGMALQFNYLLDKGAFVAQPDGAFRVETPRMRAAVRELTHDLLMLEARGDYAGARGMLDRLAVIRPEVQKALDRLAGIPTDIEPLFVTADAVAPEGGPAFARVEDVSGLPRVLLIGDSISIGYTPAVRELLRGKANVHRIPVNGGPTINGLAHLAEWLGSGRWDVIHFNWGLHDLRQDQSGARQVPLEPYERNLRELVSRLKQTGARLIWASTTPVPGGKVSPPRVNSDVEAYNAAARRVMEESGVAIDDLYGFALPQLDRIQLPVNVHFTEAGSRALAGQVAAAVMRELAR